MEKRKIIVDYKNITAELLQLLTETYPDGYDEKIVRFKNAKGEMVQSVPLETDDTKYLFKISVELERKVERYIEEMEEDDSDTDDSTDAVGDVDANADLDD